MCVCVCVCVQGQAEIELLGSQGTEAKEKKQGVCVFVGGGQRYVVTR